MDIITTASEGECEEGCGGQRLRAAIEVLTNNNVHPIIFAEAMKTLFKKDGGNFRNIMVTGPVNCGKTFLFDPLKSLFIFKSCKQQVHLAQCRER